MKTSVAHELLGDNVAVLGQSVSLLEALDGASFEHAAPELRLSGVGPHLRHILDFYGRFLDTLESEVDGRIDYDNRIRDTRIETSLDHAKSALRNTIDRLHSLSSDPARLERALEIRSDGSPWIQSNTERELQSLVSHTVHHYALIAVALRAAGVDPGTEFGVAPSTLRHWSDQRHQNDRACAR